MSPLYCLVLLLVPLAADPEPKLSVLIVDGMNNHDWPRATSILREILEGSGRFCVNVSTSPAADASPEAWDRWRPDFTQHDVVVSNFNGGHKATSRHWPREVEKALEDYVSNGGGLVIHHSANNSFPNWSAYNEMIGLGWRGRDFGPSLVVSSDEEVIRIPKGEGRNPGHGPEHDFQVTVLAVDHPITHGLPKKWMHPHEQLTHGQHGPARNLTVLTYAHSKDTGDNEVVDWVIPSGKGRVYVTMQGHLWRDKPDTALRCLGFQTMLIRGCQWAATGRVSYPVPTDFPTAKEMRLRVPATVKKPEDRVIEHINHVGTVLSVRSRGGIGRATIDRESWPEPLRLRLHLGGLEELTLGNDSITLKASLLSHGPHRMLLSLVDDGVEKTVALGDPYWLEIKAFDANDEPVQGLSGAGGYFETVLPRALFEEKPESLTIGWIDFYRH